MRPEPSWPCSTVTQARRSPPLPRAARHQGRITRQRSGTDAQVSQSFCAPSPYPRSRPPGAGTGLGKCAAVARGAQWCAPWRLGVGCGQRAHQLVTRHPGTVWLRSASTADPRHRLPRPAAGRGPRAHAPGLSCSAQRRAGGPGPAPSHPLAGRQPALAGSERQPGHQPRRAPADDRGGARDHPPARTRNRTDQLRKALCHAFSPEPERGAADPARRRADP